MKKYTDRQDNYLTTLAQLIKTRIIAPDEVIRCLIAAFITGGHVLLEGFPGTGKTTLAKHLANLVGLKFKRIQFTPDLIPTDLIGYQVFDKDSQSIRFEKGPIFSNILLADEINRAPARTQSALLECMDELQVTVDGFTHSLTEPYFVIATQNPISFAGTFELPENQLDRFALKLPMTYLSPENEVDMIEKNTVEESDTKTNNLSPEQFKCLQTEIRSITIERSIKLYAANLIKATRSDARIAIGASPRATLTLLNCAQAFAYMENLQYVIPEQIQRLFPYVVTHRLQVGTENFEAITANDCVTDILRTVEPPR